MQFTPLEVAVMILGLCLSIVACATLVGVLMAAERNRFDRYERVRRILQDICNADGPQATRLLAVHELRKYREYAPVVAQAFAQGPAPAAAPVTPPKPEKPAQVVQLRQTATIAPFPSVKAVPARPVPVETPKRDILDGVIIRERGRPVKASALREFLRFRDAVTDRLIPRSY